MIKTEITLIDQALPILKQCIQDKDKINQEAFFTLVQEQKNFKAKVFKVTIKIINNDRHILHYSLITF